MHYLYLKSKNMFTHYNKLLKKKLNDTVLLILTI